MRNDLTVGKLGKWAVEAARNDDKHLTPDKIFS